MFGHVTYVLVTRPCGPRSHFVSRPVDGGRGDQRSVLGDTDEIGRREFLHEVLMLRVEVETDGEA